MIGVFFYFAFLSASGFWNNCCLTIACLFFIPPCSRRSTNKDFNQSTGGLPSTMNKSKILDFHPFVMSSQYLYFVLILGENSVDCNQRTESLASSTLCFFVAGIMSTVLFIRLSSYTKYSVHVCWDPVRVSLFECPIRKNGQHYVFWQCALHNSSRCHNGTPFSFSLFTHPPG